MFRFEKFDSIGGIAYGVSQVVDGNMARKYQECDGQAEENRAKFFNKVGIQVPVVELPLDLKSGVIYVDRENCNNLPEVDGAVTREKGLPLMVTLGDCYPVFFYDPKNVVLGLAHMSRMGIDGDICKNMVELCVASGANLEELIVGVGPGIKKESYLWDGEVPVTNPEWKGFLTKRADGKWMIDEFGLLLYQLRKAGIREENIEASLVDTVASSEYFSHVRSHNSGYTEKEGRFLAVAMLS